MILEFIKNFNYKGKDFTIMAYITDAGHWTIPPQKDDLTFVPPDDMTWATGHEQFKLALENREKSLKEEHDVKVHPVTKTLLNTDVLENLGYKPRQD